MTIEDIQSRLETAVDRLRSPEYEPLQDALRPLIPQGFRPRILLYEAGRKKKKNAAAENWSPESGEIRIFFEPLPPSTLETPTERSAASRAPASESTHRPAESPLSATPLSDLVRALDRTESRPGLGFVALKWFRDTVLPAEGFSWCRSDAARQGVLREAIDKRLVLTSKVANPRDPLFPVTSVRLNRLLPEVQLILGTRPPSGDDFDPAPIRGESLSATVLRERR